MRNLDERRDHWARAVDADDVASWTAYLRDLPDCDLLPYVADVGSLRDWHTQEQVPLARWLTQLLQSTIRDVHGRMRDKERDIRERLALATYSALIDKLRILVWRSETARADRRGALVYYTDLLQCAVLLDFDVQGEVVQFNAGLAFPKPHAYLDPVQVLAHARSRADVDLVKSLLGSPRRLVAHRGLIAEVDRVVHKGVFGPTIDTLFLCDWLHARVKVRTAWREKGKGAKILEIGCGSGLILSTFASEHNSAGTLLEGVDVDPRAVQCTFENIRRNSGDRRSFLPWVALLTGRFDARRYPNRYDLILCNPPYIPDPPFFDGERAGAAVATHGTELIREVLQAAPDLLVAGGKLLMVSSRLADEEIVDGARLSGLSFSLEATRKVPFDIQRMDTAHLEWLASERGLSLLGNTAEHEIAIYRLELVA